MSDDNSNQPSAKPRLAQVVMSILGAAFGVQSEKTRQRDFQHGKPLVYIVGGLAFTTAFVLILVAIVSMVLD